MKSKYLKLFASIAKGRATISVDRKYNTAFFSANPLLLKRLWSVQLMQRQHIWMVSGAETIARLALWKAHVLNMSSDDVQWWPHLLHLI
jgi:hypothetical protein